MLRSANRLCVGKTGQNLTVYMYVASRICVGKTDDMNANVCHQYHCYGDEKVSSMFVDRREGFQEDMTIRSL